MRGYNITSLLSVDGSRITTVSDLGEGVIIMCNSKVSGIATTGNSTTRVGKSYFTLPRL